VSLALVASNPDAKRSRPLDRVIRRLRFADADVRTRAAQTDDADRAARYLELSRKIGAAMLVLSTTVGGDGAE
jgi:hypothetical protein